MVQWASADGRQAYEPVSDCIGAVHTHVASHDIKAVSYTHLDLLLMDEPYAQLDIKFRFHLEDAILKLSRDTNSTLIFVTHNSEEAVYLSERCIVLTNKPTYIKAIRTIDLTYPRDICSPEFVAIKDEITEMIKWW